MKKKNVTKGFCIRNFFVEWNMQYKWITVEHDWRGVVLHHKWSWGFGHGVRYYKTYLPF